MVGEVLPSCVRRFRQESVYGKLPIAFWNGNGCECAGGAAIAECFTRRGPIIYGGQAGNLTTSEGMWTFGAQASDGARLVHPS